MSQTAVRPHPTPHTPQVNGFTSLNLTKLDVLDDMDEIQVGVRYMYEGKELDSMPSNLQVRT